MLGRSYAGRSDIAMRAGTNAAVGLLLFVLVALPAAPALAHAVVTGSSLKDQPVKAHTAVNVVLNFNSGIEVSLSRVFLVSKGDVYQPLTIHAGSKAGQLIVELPPLAEGDYALKYRVFAADGHLTEDIIRFHVSR
jgi:copper resistance protein C